MKTALDSERLYCYAPQANDVMRLCRRLFVMSPCHACNRPDQIIDPEPVFFFVENHPRPVPPEFWERLKNATIVAVWTHTLLTDGSKSDFIPGSTPGSPRL
jgi:hypothetical protein